MQGRIVAFISSTILVGLTFQGCEYYPLKSDPDYRFFQIRVNSVSVVSPLRVVRPGRGEVTWLVPRKSPLAVDDTMRVAFYGWIGHDGCHESSHIDTTRIDLVGYRVKVWSWARMHGGCVDIVMEIRSVLDIYPPLRIGTWIFLVSQPDGSVLRKEVVVQR